MVWIIAHDSFFSAVDCHEYAFYCCVEQNTNKQCKSLTGVYCFDPSKPNTTTTTKPTTQKVGWRFV